MHIQSILFTSRKIALLGLTTLSLALTIGCGDDDNDSEKTPGKATLEITVVDAESSEAIADAHIVIQNGDTGTALDVLTSDADGLATIEIDATDVAQVLLRISAQGYISSPPDPHTAPVPHALTADETTAVTVELAALTDATNLGTLSGTIFDTDGTTGVDGALVISTTGTTNRSVATQPDGSYTLFNVPAGDATVSAWKAGKSFDELSAVTVVASETTADTDITASGDATGTVSGNISFLASSNAIVDITLLHPVSGDVIPGLRTFNETNNEFTLEGVPDGTYNATATFENDGYVLDPDSLVKHGIPTVTVTSGSTETLDFDVTGAVAMRAPLDNPVLPINAAVFEWVPYSSASDYVVEVSDVSGNIIWGGFNADKTKAFTVLASDTQTDADTSAAYHSATFNSDGNATAELLEGRTYRVRVYASKDVNINQDALEYKLISASEGLIGVFTAGAAE